jgi:hypothetical protein
VWRTSDAGRHLKLPSRSDARYGASNCRYAVIPAAIPAATGLCNACMYARAVTSNCRYAVMPAATAATRSRTSASCSLQLPLRSYARCNPEIYRIRTPRLSSLHSESLATQFLLQKGGKFRRCQRHILRCPTDGPGHTQRSHSHQHSLVTLRIVGGTHDSKALLEHFTDQRHMRIAILLILKRSCFASPVADPRNCRPAHVHDARPKERHYHEPANEHHSDHN